MAEPIKVVAELAAGATDWPDAASREVPVQECGETMVTLDDDLLCLNLYRADRWPGTREQTWSRASVRARLVHAASTLPSGYSIAVFDAWRSRVTVRALYDAYYGPGSELPPGFVADPDDADLVPPHLTGGAVDVTLTLNDVPLGLGTWFDDFTVESAAGAFEAADADEQTRHHRRLLHSSMRLAGFVGIASEWWHFSYGDQTWAAHVGRAAAAYGITEPPG